MIQTGLYDLQQRFDELDNVGDTLVKLNDLSAWESFRATLETVRNKKLKSKASE